MTPAYAVKPGFTSSVINVGAQKIDGLVLKTFCIILAWFSLQDSLGRVRLFEETFLLPNINMKMILEMLFLSLSNADIEFTE